MAEGAKTAVTRGPLRRDARPWGIVLLTLGVILAAPVRPARAVPVPFKNCGKAGDIISISSLDASVWPPVGSSAPLAGTATFEGSGKLVDLTVELGVGPDFVFRSAGGLNATLVGGFVALPSSVPLTLVSPSLPIAAGPYNLVRTFLSPLPGAQSVQISSHTTVGQSIAALVASLGLTFAGNSGFPVPPAAGTYGARLALTLPSGAGVLCMDLQLANTPFIVAAGPVPALPGWGALALGVLLLAVGGWALHRRSRASVVVAVAPGSREG